jgi:predicted protein tyrosine phosphatase
MIQLKISDIRDAPFYIFEWATKTVSLLDPGTELSGFSNKPDHLIRWFHDVDAPADWTTAPTEEDFAAILAFADGLQAGDRLLVHCHAGISRSTAAAITILMQRGMPHTEALRVVQAVRPQLWPNSLIIAMADRHFNLDGQLVQMVRDFKKTEMLNLAYRTKGDPEAEAVELMKRYISAMGGSTT